MSVSWKSMNMLPPLWPPRETAIFVDLDGTLIDFAPTPDSVTLPDGLPEQINTLTATLGGALAIISGRPVAALESLFGPTAVFLSGVHGSELKEPGAPTRHLAPPLPAALQQGVAALTRRWPELLIEDKGEAIAVHYRQAPELAAAVADALERLIRNYRPGFEIMSGAAVYEIRPTTVDKGTALRNLMRLQPFAGRRPVFLGDDTTDEDGIAAAVALGGHGIAVGPRHSLTANWHLPSPAAARQWLRDFAAQRLG